MAVILCTAGYDHFIRFWEAPTGLGYKSIQYRDSQVNKLCITNDKKYLAVAANPKIGLFEINGNSSKIASFDGHHGNVTSIGFQRDSRWMYSASEDGTIKIWDVRAAKCQRNYKVNSPVTSASLHPNQGEIISGDQSGTVSVWDLTADKSFPVHTMSPDGSIEVRAVTVASDGSILVAANSRGTCFVWSLLKQNQYEPLHKVDAHSSYILQAMLSPDVKYLATTSSDKTCKIWNVEQNFTLDKTLIGHQRWVWDCVFSADAAYLVTVSSDKTARLWDLSTGDSIIEYQGHTKAITCVALNDTSSE